MPPAKGNTQQEELLGQKGLRARCSKQAQATLEGSPHAMMMTCHNKVMKYKRTLKERKIDKNPKTKKQKKNP